MTLRLGLPLFVASLLSGCPPPPNFLDGSIKDGHDLTFDSVSVRYLSDQLVYQISYFKSLEEGADTVAKITFNEPEGGVVANQEISLLAPEAEARIERVTAANDPFPEGLNEGFVMFYAAPVVGETASGEFSSTFSDGRTLNGGFETTLTTCSFDDPDSVCE